MLSLSLAVLLAAQAQAPIERLHVEWLAPEGCPSRDALAASLETSVPPNRTFHASVRIDEPRQDGGLWRAVVITTADGNQRTRVVEGIDCERVTEAAVLVVTLAATNLPPVKEPPPLPAPNFKAPPAEAEDSGNPSPPDPPSSLRFKVQPLIGAHAGLFPLPAVSYGAALALGFSRLHLQLSVAEWIAIQGTGRSIRGGMLAASLRGCWLFAPTDAVRLGPCTAVEAGRLVVEAAGVAAPAPTAVPWGSLLAGVTAGHTVSKSVTPWVTAELGVNLVRPQFYVLEENRSVPLYAVGWVVGRLTVGVEFELTIP